MEKCLYYGGFGLFFFVVLFGFGVEIKYLEIEKRCLIVDVFYLNVSVVDDKEFIFFIGNYVSGICVVYKFVVYN